MSYLKTRVRALRLLNAARILAIVELSRRLHQAYRQAYDKQAADWLLPQNPQPLPSDLKDRVSNIVNNPETDCAEFIKKLIGNLTGKAFSDDPMKLFERVENEKGFRLGNTGKYGGLAGITSGKREVTIRPVASTTDPRLSEHQAYAYAVTALNELMHHAKNSGMYSDRDLARAISKLQSPDQLAANPLPKTNDVDTNSAYFHSLFKLHCR